MDVGSHDGMVLGFHFQRYSGFACWAFVHGSFLSGALENTTFPLQYTTEIHDNLLICGRSVIGDRVMSRRIFIEM